MLLDEHLKSKSDKNLIEQYKELNDSIEKFDCFNPKDLYLLNCIEKELYNRGYEYTEKKVVDFIKKGEKE